MPLGSPAQVFFLGHSLLALAARTKLNVVDLDSADAREGLQQSAALQEHANVSSGSGGGIIIIMAAAHGAQRGGRRGGGFGGGYSGGNYHYRPKPSIPPEPPKWTRMPMGCEVSLNQGLCNAMLYQRTCEVKFAGESGISAEAACARLWPGEPKKEPRHMYCLAAARDERLIARAAELAGRWPVEAAQCKVSDLRHLVVSGIKNGSVHVPDRFQVPCRELLKGDPTGFDNGFCRSASSEGQDCGFFYGIRDGWKQKYGKAYCESLQPRAGAMRCLALRKQIIRIAQAKSMFGTAMFTTFDEVVRLGDKNCPPQPDTPKAPNEDDIEDAEKDEDA